MKSDKICLNITEASEQLSLSRQSIYKLINSDSTFPIIHIGKSVRIPSDALSAWVEARLVKENGINE